MTLVWPLSRSWNRRMASQREGQAEISAWTSETSSSQMAVSLASTAVTVLSEYSSPSREGWMWRSAVPKSMMRGTSRMLRTASLMPGSA
jgi:hypothetical protein